MTNPFVPATPVVVSIQLTNFFGQPAAIISGTEDLSGLPSGESIAVAVYDASKGEVLASPFAVNSDGTWGEPSRPIRVIRLSRVQS